MLSMPIYLRFTAAFGDRPSLQRPFYGWIQDLCRAIPTTSSRNHVITMVLTEADASARECEPPDDGHAKGHADHVRCDDDLPSERPCSLHRVNMFLSIAQQVFIRKRMAAKA